MEDKYICIAADGCSGCGHSKLHNKLAGCARTCREGVICITQQEYRKQKLEKIQDESKDLNSESS